MACAYRCAFLFSGNRSILPGLLAPVSAQCTSVRTKYGDWRTIKDHGKRECLRQFGAERLRINTIRKNKVLPAELRELADREINEQPRNSNYVTDGGEVRHHLAAKGVVLPWRLSRIMFRQLVDYNQMSGVIRAKW